MKNYKKLYKELLLENESLKDDNKLINDHLFKASESNRKLREENYEQMQEIKYYNGISDLLEKYHNYMIKDINLLLDKDIIENYIKLLKAAKGE